MDNNNINQGDWKGRSPSHSPSTHSPSNYIVYDSYDKNIIFYFEDYKPKLTYETEVSNLLTELKSHSIIPLCLLEIITHLSVDNLDITYKTTIKATETLNYHNCRDLIAKTYLYGNLKLLLHNVDHMPKNILTGIFAPLFQIRTTKCYFTLLTKPIYKKQYLLTMIINSLQLNVDEDWMLLEEDQYQKMIQILENIEYIETNYKKKRKQNGGTASLPTLFVKKALE